ncbi:MAG TPA: hypothetical protein VM925_37810, partial [Labilithrix sp.]|nr:hypothetical protein [Labilithrix sp.]
MRRRAGDAVFPGMMPNVVESALARRTSCCRTFFPVSSVLALALSIGACARQDDDPSDPARTTEQ